MTKLIDRCFSLVDTIARLPTAEDEKLVCWGLDTFGFEANGKYFFPLLKNVQFGRADADVFPDWLIDYMSNAVESMRSFADHHASLQFINGYKGEFYRAAAFNFLNINRSVFRLTDECAEYINDLQISKIRLSEINFPVNAFSLFFRMDDREFIIMVKKDGNYVRMTGVNTTINIEVEPAFASHVLDISSDIYVDKIIRDEKCKWDEHVKLTKFTYDLSGCRGFDIVQHRMRAFVMKFLFMYNSKLLDKSHDRETIKRAKIGTETHQISPTPYRINYVSLGVREREQMELHREVVESVRLIGEKHWTKPWWGVVAHVRTFNGIPKLIGSYKAYRRAGKVEKDAHVEQVITL